MSASGRKRTKTRSFPAAGERELVADLLVHGKQLAPRERVRALGTPLREANERAAGPFGRREARGRLEVRGHEVVGHGDEGLARAGIALAAAAAEELAVDAARVVPLGADDMQAAR